MPLVAVIVTRYGPAVPGPGVPLSVAVPSPLFVKPTPAGRAPAAVMLETVGEPVVVIVNVPALPTVKVAALALVMAGAVDTGGVICPQALLPQASAAPAVA